MPIDSRSRPIGVTVLSFVAFAVSPAFVVLLGFFYSWIFVKSIPPSFTHDTAAFLWLCFWVPIASACFLILAWISFTVGLDLWRLKNRGRKLASASMILSLLPGIVYLLIPGISWKLLGATVCTLSVFFLAYLRLPSVEQRFDSSLRESRR